MKETDSVVKTKLANGLTIVTETVNSVESVSAGIWAKTGSRNETERQAGITHFLEHMLFKGTENRSSYDIALSMESVGGYLNAFTASEYTCYYSRCLKTQLEKALDVLSDMVLHPAFPEQEIAKEKKVVIEEMKMYRDRPSDFLLENFSQNLFKGHPLGRPVLGYEQTVTNFKRDDLFDYINDRYQPRNLLIAVAGKVDHGAVVKLGKKFFDGVPAQKGRAHNPPLTCYEPTTQTLEKAIEQTHLVVGRRGLSFDHPDKYILLLVNTILGGGMSSRLHQNVREKYGYCYSISSFNQTYSDSGIYGIYVGTDIDYADHVKELIFGELQRLKDEAVPPKELAEAKEQLKGKLLLSFENMSNRMRRLAKSEIYYHRFIPADELITNIEAVSAEDIKKFSAHFFDKKQYSEAILKPES